MPENTIGKIILEAGSRAQAQTGGGAPGLSGLIGGDGAEGAATKIQKETRGWQANMLKGIQGQPRWWTRMFKTMGIQVGLSGILKQSQIFTSTIGSLFQILGAFVDVILAPFVPLFIPAIRWLARKLPSVAKWAEGFADKVKVWGIKLMDFFKDPWGNMKRKLKEWWDSAWTTIKEWALKQWDEFKYTLGDIITPITKKIPGVNTPKALQRPVTTPVRPGGEEGDWGDRAKAAADKAWDIASKGYLATLGTRGIGKVLATGARTTVPTAGLAKPIGTAIDFVEELTKIPNKTANALIKSTFRVGGSVLDAATGGRLPIPKWARLGAVDDAAQAGGSGWGALGASDDTARAAAQTGRFGNIFNRGKGIAKTLFNNPLTRTAARSVTGVYGTAAMAGYETAEGAYDTMNLAKQDKPWFGGVNPDWGMLNPDSWKPWKKDAWLPSPDRNMLQGKLDDVIMRGTGTAAIPIGALFGGQGGATVGMGISEYTAWGTGTQRQDLWGDFGYPVAADLGAAIKDGFSAGTQNIPGLR